MNRRQRLTFAIFCKHLCRGQIFVIIEPWSKQRVHHAELTVANQHDCGLRQCVRHLKPWSQKLHLGDQNMITTQAAQPGPRPSTHELNKYH